MVGGGLIIGRFLLRLRRPQSQVVCTSSSHVLTHSVLAVDTLCIDTLSVLGFSQLYALSI